MNEIEQAFFEAVLADIAYVDDLDPDMEVGEFAAAIKFRVSEPLAKLISERFEVLAVESDPNSDYQGVVFLDKTTGELYLANRGTESLTDTVVADLDLAVLSSVAKDQTATMVNWWLRISQAADTQVAQIESSYLNNFDNIAPVAATGEIADALAAAGGKITVVGHSLGGHLTTVFASLFSSQVAHSSTFNGAGLFSSLTGEVSPHFNLITWAIDFLNGDPLARAAELIGAQVVLPGDDQQDNFYANNGLNLTTNDWSFEQIGERIALFNEQSTVLGTDVPNHFMYKLTDSLALMAALERLDSTVRLETLNQIFEAGSTTMLDSNEKLLDAFRRLILGGAISNTPPIDDGGDWEKQIMPPERFQYHQNLAFLQDSDAFINLKGKLSIRALSGQDALDLAQGSNDAYAYRYALLHLNPFVVTGLDYQHFNGQGELDLYNPATGTGQITQQWLADRAELLHWKLELGLIDRVTSADDPSYISNGRSLWLEDRASELTLHLGALSEAPHILFGKDDINAGDVLLAGALGGRLYGGAGNDTLFGQSGEDYLEAAPITTTSPAMPAPTP